MSMEVCCVWAADVSFPIKQSTLPVESVAAYGCTGAVCEGVRATSLRDIHAGSQQGLYHVTTGLCRDRSKVLVSDELVAVFLSQISVISSLRCA